MSDEKKVDVYCIPETVYNTTPATPNWVYVRKLTGVTADLEMPTFNSGEMSADAEIQAVTTGNKRPSLTIPFELSYGTFDALIAAALRGAFSSDVLDAGVLRTSFSFLFFFSDLDSGEKRYHVYTGVEVDQLAMTFPVEGNVTGSFNLFGKGKTMSTTPPTGSVFLTSNGNPPFVSKGGTLNEGGSGFGIATEVSFTLANGLAPKWTWGSDETSQQAIGQRNLTFNLAAYLDDGAIAVIEKREAGTETSVEWTIADALGNEYTFDIPAAKYTGAPINVSGSAIPIAFPGQAYVDSVSGTSFTITRSDA